MPKKQKPNVDNLKNADYSDSEINKLTQKQKEEAAEAQEYAAEILSMSTENKDPDLGVLAAKDGKSEDLAGPTPDISSPEWTDYVISLLVPNELDNKNPKADGLRRVATKIFGEFSIESSVLQVPTPENGERSTVTTVISLRNGLRYSGSADAGYHNTDRNFAIHSVACAETKSEARALRRLLRLTKIVTHDEIANVPELPDNPDQINDGMINSLLNIGAKAQVNVEQVAKNMGMEFLTLKNLTKAQGTAIVKQLSLYKTKEKEPQANERSY